MVMSLHEKIGQMFLVGFEGLSAPEYLLNWLSEGKVGGVILFARNVQSPRQLANLTTQIHAAAKTPALIAIDQEGGTVARLREGFTESPGAMALSACGDQDETYTRAISEVLAKEMRALGINWTYAPAVDIAYNAQNPTIGTRSFGSDNAVVSRMAGAAVDGFQRGGVAACAKHFPGLGNTAIDTHVALATIEKPIEALIEDDLPPYRAAIAHDVATIMTTHTVFSTLDTQHPATLSGGVIQRLLREELGYQGVVTSDCMEMKAISGHYGAGESAVLGALAGLDVILFSHTRAVQEQAIEALIQAVNSGRVPVARIEEACARVQALKARYAITTSPDLSVIRAVEHTALADEIARAAVTTIRGGSALPITGNQKVALVEFASILESEVVESGGHSGLGKLLAQSADFIPYVALLSGQLDQQAALVERAGEYARATDTLIIATRNAHLIPPQMALAQELAQTARRVIVLCLRNPYDAALFPGADTILCTFGDSAPSLSAGVAALLGEFTPSGRVPVEVE